ncbi:hypothetical protein [Thiothrix nivea]|uniref:DUF4214 domain-containing protein n=1 Tax=Thiothrix nivea (strain ATCC 35100 / DSM 5205 / JP2) TaxID=870187 RepID=A0A656HDJ8_THINJ|nr:hypothetical protein [Thiothrix nivea]EIJ34262.1 hypothetical protein Thini_1679 [Thiothrix nivea DSM 5205]
MATDQMNRAIVDLYVAWFNRAPDVHGYQYWVDEYNNKGVSLIEISNAFFNAAVSFPEMSGYSAEMTDSAFIRQLYDGLMGRGPGSGAEPDDMEVNYWTFRLKSEFRGDKGALVIQMIDEIRSFDASSSPAIQAIQDRFNNKMSTALQLVEKYQFGADLSPTENITLGKQILAVVTSDPASVDQAITTFLKTPHTVIGTEGNDVLNASARPDIFVFADNATHNGLDTVIGFAIGDATNAGDKFDFSAFLDEGAGLSLKLANILGNSLTLMDPFIAQAANIDALLSLSLNIDKAGKAVLLTADGGGNTNIFYLNDGNSSGILDKDEITLVGVAQGVDISSLDATHFIL